MKKIFPLLVLLSLSQNIFAQDERIWRASIGAGLAFKKNLRAGNTYKNLDKETIIKPIPIITGSIGRFSLGPQGISIKAWGDQGMGLNAFINRSGDRYHGLGMDDRKDSVFVGMAVRFFKYGFNISKDINGRSKGLITQFNYGELYAISPKFFLRVGFELEWLDDHYAEYYYSVRKNEATANRREYHLNNYFRPGVNLLPVYNLSEKSTLLGALGIKLVPKSVRNSPTMNGDKLEIGGFVGYSFSL